MIRSTQLPNLPGYSFNFDVGRTRFPRCQLFEYIGGKVPYLSEKGLQLGTEVNKFPSVYARGEVPDLPTWVVYDKETLAFDAYYLENIYEGGFYKNYVVHNCRICYFLEDGTIQVFEKPEINSGLPQGCIIKRQKIQIPGRANGSNFYDMLDLNIGREIEFYGRVFKITNCDLFTRRFLNKLGICVPDPTETPEDPYLKQRSLEGQKQQLKKPLTQKKLEWDNRILTFKGYWDDTGSGFGLLHKLKILYYLSDGTIEVRDVTDVERSYTLVRRGKFPREMETSIPGPGMEEEVTLLNVLGPSVEKSRSVVDPLGLGIPDKSYYTDKDLTIGSVLASYGRKFVIVDMDPFTKEYYHQRYGLEDISPIDLPKSKEELAMEKGNNIRPATPPYNGFGSFDDSLHNVRHLIPENKVRMWKRDPAREPLGYDSKILRFGAYLIEEGVAAANRRFVISYFLIDDTISVYEIPFANSGRDGGVILRRRKVYLPGQNIYSSKPPAEVPLQDFRLGNTIVLDNFKFHIVDIDEYSMKYMELHPNEFPLSNVRTILNKVREGVRNNYKQWAAPFMQDQGPVTYQKYRDSLKAILGDKITEHEILALARRFNKSPTFEDCQAENKKDSLRAVIHDDLRRFLFEDFDRLEESFRHFDPGKTGRISPRDTYCVLRGARLPIRPDLLENFIQTFFSSPSNQENNSIDYKELIDFLNYKKHQVPSVNKLDFKGTFGLPSLVTSPDLTKILLVDVKGIIDELQLEDDLKKESI